MALANITNNILTDTGVNVSSLTPTSTTISTTAPLQGGGDLSANRTLSITQSGTSSNGFLSSTDWNTFNNKQAAGNYMTSLTGEATGTGPGATAVTLNNASVTAKVLTGVNITGGTVVATDTMLTAFGKLQNQVNGLIGGSIYQGTWNAATNTPTLTSSVGTQGYYYIVSVAGTTNLDGITDWFVGDWAIFNGGVWQQVDNTDAVVSVNGQTGAVSLTTDNISEGVTNLYFTNTRARAALSFVAGSGAYNSSTGAITIPTNTSQLTNGANFITLASLSGTAPISYNSGTGAISITQAATASNGYLSSTDWNTFNNKQPAGNYVPYTGANANVDLGIYFLKTSKVYNTYDWLQEKNFGYSASWKTLAIGSLSSANDFSLAFGVDLSGNPGSSFTGNGSEYFWRNSGSFKTPNSANTEYNTLLSWNSSGQMTFNNAATFSSSVTIGNGLGLYGQLYYTNTYAASAPFEFLKITYGGGIYCGIKMTVYNPVNSIDSGLGFSVMTSAGAYVQPLYLSGSGNSVGIGTITPTTKLEVIGDTSNVNGYADGSIQVTGLSPIAFVGPSNLNPSLNRWGFKLRQVTDGDFTIYNYRQSTSPLIIKDNGAVCLGTTAAYGSNLLNVNGSIYSTGNIAAVVAADVDLFTFISTSASYTKSCFVGSIAAAGSTSSYYFYGQQSTSSVSLKIFTNGNIQNTNNSYGSISDARLKENIKDATPKLEDLMKVKVRNYNLIGESNKQLGVISQELEEIFPNMIEESTNIGESMKIKGVKYSVFVPMLIKAVQELKAEIETLKNK
jgi:hypothetical protein